MHISVGMIVFTDNDFRSAYHKVETDTGEHCSCGSIKFIQFEKTQYANGITADRICLACGLVYWFDWMRGIYALSSRGGTEEPVYHARWFIRGVHTDELVSSYQARHG